MDEIWLVNELARIGGKFKVSVEQSIIEDILLFQSKEVVNSMQSLGLQMSEHEPITRYVFDQEKLDSFCSENNIQWYFDEYGKVYHFKMNGIHSEALSKKFNITH